MRFAVRIRLTSHISSSKTFPSKGANLFRLESSSLRIYGLSYLG